MKNTAKFQLSHSKTLTSTPTPIVNIAGGGEYPLSAFNQFKHFLALSLLITGIISQYLPHAVFLPQSKNKNQKNAQTPTGIMISTKKQFHLLGENQKCVQSIQALSCA
jgi:hypothetical protein